MKILIVNCFDTYENRVDLLYDYFLQKGEVTVITSDFAHREKRVREQNKPYTYLKAKPYYKNLSVKRILSHMDFAKQVGKLVEKSNYDLVWTVVPANSLMKQVIKAKKGNAETKFVFDFMDMWPETMPVMKLPLVFKPWANLRDNYLKYADLVVTECELFQEKLLSYVKKSDMHTLYLARKNEKRELSVATDEKILRFCYLGSINNIIDIPEISRVINLFSGEKELHIIGDGEKRQEFITYVENTGVKVIYHGTIYDDKEKQDIISKCNFGINMMKDSVFVGVTMKSIDYWQYGIPTINNIKGDTWNLTEKYHIGINVDKETTKIDEAVVEKSRDYMYRKQIVHTFEKLFTVEVFNQKLDEIFGRIF